MKKRLREQKIQELFQDMYFFQLKSKCWSQWLHQKKIKRFSKSLSLRTKETLLLFFKKWKCIPNSGIIRRYIDPSPILCQTIVIAKIRRDCIALISCLLVSLRMTFTNSFIRSRCSGDSLPSSQFLLHEWISLALSASTLSWVQSSQSRRRRRKNECDEQ